MTFVIWGLWCFHRKKIVDSTYTNSELALKKFSMPKVRWVEKSMLPPEVTVVTIYELYIFIVIFILMTMPMATPISISLFFSAGETNVFV